MLLRLKPEVSGDKQDVSETKRAWYLQSPNSSESDSLGCLLRQWASRPENGGWSLDCLRCTTDMAALVQTHQPNVLVVSDPSCLSGSWLTDVLAQGIGLVVAIPLDRAAAVLPLAEQYAVQMVPLPASSDELGLALHSVLAAVRRQRCWQERIDQLEQRLNDRIVIERAKGILGERLGISEKEAYQRLRLQSRRQRRPIRDIAQCLLDAQPLFSPEKNGSGEASSPLCQPLVDRPSEKM
jgi:AmiR/NasT family two-component response regulator